MACFPTRRARLTCEKKFQKSIKRKATIPNIPQTTVTPAIKQSPKTLESRKNPSFPLKLDRKESVCYQRHLKGKVCFVYLQDPWNVFGRISHRITLFRSVMRITLENSEWISQRQSQSHKKTYKQIPEWGTKTRRFKTNCAEKGHRKSFEKVSPSPWVETLWYSN